MANFSSINNIPVSEIEKIPIRRVILGKTVYSTRYDEETGTIYYLNEQGQLTGEFKQVAVVAQSEPSTPKKVRKKELKKQLARKTAEDSESDTIPENVMPERSAVKNTEERKTEQPVDKQWHFYPKAFIAGMAIVFVCAVIYLVSTGGIL